MDKTCALIVGHSLNSPGACNSNHGDSEYSFNSALADKIIALFKEGFVKKVYRDCPYSKLPAKVNALVPDFVLSLHCNSFNKKASGTEVLHFHLSSRGRIIAGFLQKRLVDCLKLKDRGVKAVGEEDRGGYLLKYTAAPCVIAEPFFIDNDDDLLIAKALMDRLSLAYAKAIDEAFSFLRRL